MVTHRGARDLLMIDESVKQLGSRQKVRKACKFLVCPNDFSAQVNRSRYAADRATVLRQASIAGRWVVRAALRCSRPVPKIQRYLSKR